jgi:hypothetical protein
MADPSELARAIGSLIWKDPRRILESVALLRGSGAVLECVLRGASMGKSIPAGSAIRIRVEAPRPYRVGEIVAFVVHDGLCVHRIAYLGKGARAGAYAITQGDACFNPDPPIEFAHIVGTVVEFRIAEAWNPVPSLAAEDRARAWFGRLQLALVAPLLEMDVRLATGVAKLLRLRKESAAIVET